MKNFRFALIFLLLFTPFLYSCQEGTDVVESGIYQGTIKEVEPDKTEIYVNTEDGKTLELYFTDATTLTRKGQTVPFEQLKEGGRVEVQVEKVGQRLDPVAVRILE
jgi:hypothetical protein